MATRKTRSSLKSPATKKPASSPRAPRRTGAKAAARGPGRKVSSARGSVRVRMYRVGFGDFFLLTVPGNDGPAHILIDCGVHAANIGTMDACVKDLVKATGNKLALVIVTHYHADHISGFASNYDDFAKFDHIGAVWITNRLDPSDTGKSKFLAQLTSVAQQLQLHLGVRDDDAAVEARSKVENALGVAAGGGSNAKALQLLRSGFKSKPPVHYYQGGDTPYLPPELDGAIEAEILAPSPKDSGGEFAASDNKTEQYLAAVGADGLEDQTRVQPFEKDWPATAASYPPEAFDEFDSGMVRGSKARNADGARAMESLLETMQPDVLAATADKLDGTLNNQSLVVLFTCQGKKLLFVGDAQWGNWAYWLYGKAVTGKDPGITDRAKQILGSIDFYKVGHHGSTNATPIPAVAALNSSCAAMCSTATGAYGDSKKGTEVPRTVLIESLEKQLKNRLVRSDWVAASGVKPDPEALEEIRTLPTGFSTPGDLYIDFTL